jgi:prepilin-type N-terminal cleavage/methylation domain-containing protein
MTSRAFEPGFSLVELLVALAVCSLLSAVVAGLAPPARAAFEQTPVTLNLQQRGRTAIDAMAAAIRSAAGTAVSPDLDAFGSVLPALIPLSPRPGSSETEFEAMYVVTPVPNASQGVLDRDQPGAHGVLTLAAGPGCPAVREVCGFTPGAVAAIADGSGRFDVFTVASTNSAGGEITASESFATAYPAGSFVIEVDAQYFRLDDQDDGSRALVRETAGGATQPIVDHVAAMGIQLWRGALPILLSAGDLEDGPFFSGGPEGSYDADLLTVRRIDLWISVETPAVLLHAPGTRDSRTLHATFTLRNAISRSLP